MIVFPSYHTIMALLVVYACWTTPILRWIALALTALMLLSIVPIGGHHVWDIVAAVALFAAALPLARRCEPGADRESSTAAKQKLTDRRRRNGRTFARRLAQPTPPLTVGAPG